MGVSKYMNRGHHYWQVDETITMPNGRENRFRKRRIPTKEQALALVAKARAAAFEGRHFDKVKPCTLSVTEAWALYKPVTKRDNDAAKTDEGRATHLLRLLGNKRAAELTQGEVDGYRNLRLGETTVRGTPPAPATLDREIELLNRTLGYAVRCGRLPTNPIANVKLLRQPNVRRMVLKEEALARLLEKVNEAPADKRKRSHAWLAPILVVAYDTGMRKEEVLDLKWSQVDLKTGQVLLAPQDTKTEEGRTVYLTARAIAALEMLPRDIKGGYVFVNPRTGERWKEIRAAFAQACKAAGVAGLWFHDTRRSFATNARRRGVPESVVMRNTGHKTRAAFDRYNIVEDEDMRHAVRRIEDGQAAEAACSDSRQETRQVSDQAKG
jgi:integrase